MLEAKYNHDAAGMFRFAQPFRSYAFERREGGDPWLARIELSAAILLADESVAELLADAPEPFWRHVREALSTARRPAPPGRRLPVDDRTVDAYPPVGDVGPRPVLIDDSQIPGASSRR